MAEVVPSASTVKSTTTLPLAEQSEANSNGAEAVSCKAGEGIADCVTRVDWQPASKPTATSSNEANDPDRRFMGRS